MRGLLFELRFLFREPLLEGDGDEVTTSFWKSPDLNYSPEKVADTSGRLLWQSVQPRPVLCPLVECAKNKTTGQSSEKKGSEPNVRSLLLRSLSMKSNRWLAGDYQPNGTS